jgi:hypothetical protein
MAWVCSQIADSAIALEYGAQQLDVLNQLDALEQAQQATAVAQALNELNKTTQATYSDLATSISAIRVGTAQALDAAQQLQQAQNSAAYAAAKGAGQPFVTIDGQKVGLPVNAVQNRQYDATAVRYKQAFKDAKLLACMARLSIEQRLGTHLDSIKSPIGALDAPSKWADDPASMTGIDYRAFACTPSSPPFTCDPDQGGGALAKQFIGDYVAKLGNFVDYYNVAYPFHEGDDTAIISVAQDVLGTSAACTRPSNNLLLQSGDLRDLSPNPGWRATGGNGSKRLQALTGNSLFAPNPPPVLAKSGTTWLLETADTSPADATNPPNVVYQDVYLPVGTYVLSWWAHARDASGALGSQAVQYRASLYDDKWMPVASNTRIAPVPSSTDVWGTRASLPAMSVASAGVYRVAFSASAGAEIGSIAIADVQLEQVPSPAAGPGPFEWTDSSRDVVTGGRCQASPGDVRAAFDRRCSKDGCAYVLRTPLAIHFGAPPVSQAGSPQAPVDYSGGSIAAKFAAGNYNYRHVGLAVNLVGTSVHDCSAKPSPSCYGSGYEEYSLVHSASNVAIQNPVDGQEFFEFGAQSVNHAKALAAEKFITLPLGSGDASLIGQPEIEKVELRGRPVEGVYQLVVHDSPSLRWDRVEDIQIMIKYRYWAHTTANAKGGTP